jgi:hypothetical protein
MVMNRITTSGTETAAPETWDSPGAAAVLSVRLDTDFAVPA